MPEEHIEDNVRSLNLLGEVPDEPWTPQ